MSIYDDGMHDRGAFEVDTSECNSFAADAHAGFDDDTLGGRITRAREALGLTEDDIARRLGIKASTVTAWETDRSEPRANRLVTLAGILQVSPTWLLCGRGNGPELTSEMIDAPTVRMSLVDLRKQAQALTREIERVIAATGKAA